MALEKDNSFQPDLTPTPDSIESSASSGDFLQPTEGLSGAEVAGLNQPEREGLTDEIKAGVVEEGTQVSSSPESSPQPSAVNTALPNPISEYFLLVQVIQGGGQSPHNIVNKLNAIRKSA